MVTEPPPTPNLGNLFVGASEAASSQFPGPPPKAPATSGVMFAEGSDSQDLLFIGGDPKAQVGSSNFDDEVELGRSEWWDQLLAVGVLPPDVVASGIRVTDEVLMGLFPQAAAPATVCVPSSRTVSPRSCPNSATTRASATARRMGGCSGSGRPTNFHLFRMDSALPFYITAPSGSHGACECLRFGHPGTQPGLSKVCASKARLGFRQLVHHFPGNYEDASPSIFN
jgi:hypothetical protein